MKNALYLTLLLAALSFGIFPTEGNGQAAPNLTPAIALARLCISEAGWECPTSGDGLAIHEVMSRASLRNGSRYTTEARSYARRLFGARPHDVQRLRWVGELTPACSEPRSWPQTVTVTRRGVSRVVPHAAWATFRERCLEVFAWAESAVVQYPSERVEEWSICERPVHDWGGWMDRDNAENQGLVPVMCRMPEEECDEDLRQREHQPNTCGTRNDFYCRPSLDPGCVSEDRD